jgi:hypothetical protein
MVLSALQFAQLACGILIHNEAQHQKDKAQGRKKGKLRSFSPLLLRRVKEGKVQWTRIQAQGQNG